MRAWQGEGAREGRGCEDVAGRGVGGRGGEGVTGRRGEGGKRG